MRIPSRLVLPPGRSFPSFGSPVPSKALNRLPVAPRSLPPPPSVAPAIRPCFSSSLTTPLRKLPSGTRNAWPLRPTPPTHRIKPAHIQQRRIAPQFPQQRLHRDMLEDDPRPKLATSPGSDSRPVPVPAAAPTPSTALRPAGPSAPSPDAPIPAGVPHRSRKQRTVTVDHVASSRSWISELTSMQSII